MFDDLIKFFAESKESEQKIRKNETIITKIVKASEFFPAEE